MQITRLIEVEKIPSGTSQQRGIAVVNGKARSFPKKSLIDTWRIYDEALMRIAKPQKPLEGAVSIQIVFLYGTKDKKKIRAFYKVTKPDIDNLCKPFIDSLVRHQFLADDSIIVDLSAQKRWYEKGSKIWMQIKEVNADGCERILP